MTVSSAPNPFIVSLLAIRLLITSAVPTAAEDQNSKVAALASQEDAIHRETKTPSDPFTPDTIRPFVYLTADGSDSRERSRKSSGEP